jgi:hypothetical protein
MGMPRWEVREIARYLTVRTILLKPHFICGDARTVLIENHPLNC